MVWMVDVSMMSAAADPVIFRRSLHFVVAPIAAPVSSWVGCTPKPWNPETPTPQNPQTLTLKP